MTRGELVTYVLERLGVSSSRTSFVTQVRSHLYREYRRYVRVLELQKDVANLSLVAADPFVDLPDDFLKILRLRIGTRTLSALTWDDLVVSRAAMDGVELAGAVPWRYVFMDPDRIYLDPAPTESDVDGVELFYVPAPAAWTIDDDVPTLIPEEYQHILGEATIGFFAQNQEEFATHAAMARAEEARLRAELETELVDRAGEQPGRIRRRHYG